MRFVKGCPHKGSKSCWYVVLDCREAELFVAKLLAGRSLELLRDPHRDITSVMAAQAGTALSLDLTSGVHDRKGFYVGRSGGMAPTLHKILEERERDDWPDAPRVRISRWPGGSHFYVTIDGRDFEWNGQNKWPTASSAEEAVQEWRTKRCKK
jgi:hypothetical protein